MYPLLLALMLTAAACEKDPPDAPPLNQPDGTMTLAELRALYTGQTVRFEDNVAVFATVSMGETSGNLYRNIFVEDGTAAINVRLDYASDIREGDRVRISLKGTVLGSYNNMLQLDSLEYGRHLIKQESGQAVAPEPVSVPDILNGGLQARLVRLEGVQFNTGELGKRFADVAEGLTENRSLTDCDGNQIIVRTSPFADFANRVVPEGNGSLVAVVSQFGSTWQLLIRSFEEMDMGGDRCDTGDPAGSGTFGEPYNVAFAMANNSGDGVWVEGYIIGVYETHASPFTRSFTAPFQTATNLLMADKPDETAPGNILTVQLPIGQVREALNLVANPANLGKPVKILGNLGTYFSAPGLLRASGYWLDGDGLVPQTPLWEETFASSLGSFTSYNLQGAQNWTHATYDGGCAYMSGYDGSNRANEDWLVSPSISLAGTNNPRLHIREAVNFGTDKGGLRVLVSDNYQGGDPSESGDWTELTGFNRPPGTNWTFVDSGPISLDAFQGKDIHIAFRYTSTTSLAPAWQVSLVRITHSE
jgi:hypothetical protein